jgi:hypothetical protein
MLTSSQAISHVIVGLKPQISEMSETLAFNSRLKQLIA